MRFLILVAALLSPVSSAALSAESLQYKRYDHKRGTVKQVDKTYNEYVHSGSNVMLRIIKESKTLELWRQARNDAWVMVRAYEICRFSGTAGPKKRYGDLQAPEGFYEITKDSLNPFSKEYLSINIGYPNARDIASRYTGDYIMVHGGCRSAGCFAMTDKSMEEIYAAVRDALTAGQQTIQVQIYPFRMNTGRLAKEQRNPNYMFWKELKQGWDWFAVHYRPIPVAIEGNRYVIPSVTGQSVVDY